MLAGVFWGAGFPLGKLALRQVDASHLVLLRFAFAALVALPFALRRPEARALFRSPLVLACGVIYGLAFLVQFEGLAYINVSLAALLVGAMPALIAIAARILGEPVSRLSWAGVTAASLGAALIAGRPGPGGTPLGIGLSLLALLLFLTWLMVLRRAPKPPTPMAMPAVTVIIAAATLLPTALLLHGPPKLALVSPTTWAAIACQGVVCTFLATAAWQYGAARVGNAVAGVFVNIEPLMGSVIGVTLFGDHLSPGLVLGGLSIIAGSVVVVLGERGTKAQDLAEVAATPA
jgi:drug/metabolite transporter (DMT)-like permease